MSNDDPGGRQGNFDDVDFAATPVLFKPVGCTDTLLAAQGKGGEMVVYDTRDFSNGPVARFRVSPTSSDISNIANPSWSPATGLLYVNVTSATRHDDRPEREGDLEPARAARAPPDLALAALAALTAASAAPR